MMPSEKKEGTTRILDIAPYRNPTAHVVRNDSHVFPVLVSLRQRRRRGRRQQQPNRKHQRPRRPSPDPPPCTGRQESRKPPPPSTHRGKRPRREGNTRERNAGLAAPAPTSRSQGGGNPTGFLAGNASVVCGASHTVQGLQEDGLLLLLLPCGLDFSTESRLRTGQLSNFSEISNGLLPPPPTPFRKDECLRDLPLANVPLCCSTACSRRPHCARWLARRLFRFSP